MFRSLSKRLVAGSIATVLLFGLVGATFAAGGPGPNPNGTWAYKANFNGSSYSGTYNITQFVAKGNCWVANIKYSGTYGTATGVVNWCGTKLTAHASGKILGSPVKATATGTSDAAHTKVSAKFHVSGLVSGNGTATATKQ